MKCRDPRRESYSVSLERNPRVLEYDSQGTDDSPAGIPRRIVTLVRGFAFDDAAKNPGDDPEALMACHSRGFNSVHEATYDIKYAQPCCCGRCIGKR